MRRVSLSLFFLFVGFVLSGCCESYLEDKLEGAIEEIENADKAVGMQELREAGCKEAANIPFFDRILCTVEKGTPLTCKDASIAYGKAAHETPPKEFELAIVESGEVDDAGEQGPGKVRCEGVYDPSGKKIRNVKNKTNIQKRKTTTSFDTEK